MALPVIIIITKIDLLPEEDQLLFIRQIKFVIKYECNSSRCPLLTKSQEDIVMFSRTMEESIIPIFLVSNKSGSGLDFFINYLNMLPEIRNTVDVNEGSPVQVSFNLIVV